MDRPVYLQCLVFTSVALIRYEAVAAGGSIVRFATVTSVPYSEFIHVQFTCMTRDQVFPVVLLKYTGTKGGDRNLRKLWLVILIGLW